MATSAPRSEDRPGLAAEAVRARLRERLGEAIALLEGGGGDPVETVHGFRKLMKRVRAVIRLLADANGLDLKSIEQTCRDVARQLSALRDLDVMIAALDTPEPGADVRPAALRERLARDRAEELARGVLEPATLQRMAARLRDVDAEVARQPVAHLSDDDLVGALERSHRRALKALERVRAEPVDEAFHELRKRAKRELYQREQLDGIVPLPEPRRAELLDELCDLLGEHQDLAVLRGKAEETAQLSPALAGWLGERRGRIRDELVHRVAELYG
jgi:CHAD domain-containing protein